MIAAGGLSRIVVARLEPGDVGEDEAARRVAAAAAGAEIEAAAPSPAAPICLPRRAGCWCSIRERVDRFNLVDEAMTLGTLPPYRGGRAAADGRDGQDHPVRRAGAGGRRAASRSPLQAGPLLRVAPFVPRSVGLIQTRLPGLKESILDKTREVTEGGSARSAARSSSRSAAATRPANSRRADRARAWPTAPTWC